MRLYKVLILQCACFLCAFCDSAPISRRRNLLPLTSQQFLEIVQKLKTANNLECAFIFDLKTTANKKTEIQEGKFYSRRSFEGINLRFDFGYASFLFLGKLDEKIFCSDKSKEMSLNDPIQSGHLLNFSDILMPFLEYKEIEYGGPKRVQGRNTHIICFREKGNTVEIAYDHVFEVILQVKHFNKEKQLVRTFNLLNFKKAQNTWLMKLIEIKDVLNNIITQLIIRKVVVEQTLPSEIFSKTSLGKPIGYDLTFINFDKNPSHTIFQTSKNVKNIIRRQNNCFRKILPSKLFKAKFLNKLQSNLSHSIKSKIDTKIHIPFPQNLR